MPHAVPNADERGRIARGVPSRDRGSLKRACRARSNSPGRRPGIWPPLAARPCRGRSPWSGGEGGRTMFGTTTVRVLSLAAGTVNGPYRAEPFLGPDPGLRPGLTEAALQAACLLRLIVDGIGTPPRQPLNRFARAGSRTRTTQLGVRRFRRLPMRRRPRDRSSGAGSRIWAIAKLCFARLCRKRSKYQLLVPLGHRFVRERGRCD